MPPSDWPFLHLNAISPIESPANPPVTASTADALSLPVDSSDLAAQLEAWTNISFSFEDDHPLSPASISTDKLLAKTQDDVWGMHHQTVDPADAHTDVATDMNHFDGLLARPSASTSAAPGTSGVESSPYDPRRGVGTYAPAPDPYVHHLTHHLQHDLFSRDPTFAGPSLSHPHTQYAPPFTSPAAAPISFASLLASPDGLASLLAANPDPFAGLPVLQPFTTTAGAESSADAGNLHALAGSAPSAGSGDDATTAPAPAPKKGTSARRASVKVSVAASANGGGETPEDSVTGSGSSNGGGKQPGSAGGSQVDDDESVKVAQEDDKRRRNTAASARFRVKKKLREQAIERTASELRDRVSELEKEVDGLKKENGWLRGLIVDKAAREAGSAPLPSVQVGTKRTRDETDG